MENQWEMTQFTPLRSVADWIRFAASRFKEAGLFFGHGTDNALDDAHYLVTTALHLPPQLPAYLQHAALTDHERQTVLDFIQRRVEQRIPTAYLVHEAWFAGLPFYVDESVLIPRSPVAELIATHFEPWIDAESVTRILDLCTGCGCIAIAAALAFPDAEVAGSDIDTKALTIAKQNAQRHPAAHPLQWWQADVFTGIPAVLYDVIISNPPYVDAVDMEALPAEYLHEPRSALAAGGDGLDIVRRILAEAHTYLSDQGILIVEVGNSAAALVDAYPDLPFTWLEFEQGGHGVFLLHKHELVKGR